MLDLVYSDRLERLAAALIDAVDGDPLDPFTPRVIIVPNRRIAAYLSFATARARSIVANQSLPFLERYVADRIQAAVPGTRVVDRPLLVSLVLAALDDPSVMERPELSEIAGYTRTDGEEGGAEHLRRFQLAARVADLFIGYSLDRPEMVARWEDGGAALAGTPHAATERWQRALWLAVFGAGGIARRLGGPEGAWDTLPALLRRVPATKLALPRELPVFGFSYLSPGQLEILRALSAACRVRLYALHPCREFWEDVGARGPDSPAHELANDPADEDAPALRLWGRPGRDAARLLGKEAGFDFSDAFSAPDPQPATALARLQEAILSRAPADAIPPDGSLRVLACPGIRRELEIIASEIWSLVHADPSMRFNDVAVLLAGRETALYQAHVAAVFRELGDLPCSIAELPLASESRIVEALGLLLALPLGTFARPELLRLLVHPSLLARCPGVDRDDWIHWIEAVGIAHGADRRDHEGTYIRGEHFHWDQGLCRLALGACMAGERSGIREALSLGGAASYLPLELPPDRRQSAAQLGMLARSLIADAQRLRSAELPLAEWAIVFDDLAVAYLGAESDDDVRSLERARDSLAALAALDVDGRPLGYATAREYARAQLSQLRTSQGELLADGVVVAPLGAMRALPFRAVFVAGLGEGLFPASDDAGSLDLRAARPKTGDVTPRDRDRYAFLETLLSAQQRLTLSYVCRDARSGERLQPSSVVAELISLLAGDPTVEHPLRRWDDRYFGPHADLSSVDPIGRRQAESLALRRDLARHLEERELELPSRAILERGLRQPALAEVARSISLPLIANPASAPASDSGSGGGVVADADADPRADPVVLTIDQLRRFLECPMQAWAAAVLGMRAIDVEDPIARADEPFRMSPLAETALLREVFSAAMREGATTRDALAARYRHRAALEETAGRAPTGVFGEMERRRHTAILEAWRAATASASARLVSLGRAREHARVDQLAAPLRLSHAGRTFDVTGDLQPVSPSPVGSVVLIAGELRPKHRLRALLDHAVLAASGIESGPRYATLAPGAGRPVRLRLDAWRQDEAQSYLAGLGAELAGSSHDYLLPCEAVLRWLDAPKQDLARLVTGMRDAQRPSHSSRYGPIRRVEEIEPPADAVAIVDRRFRPLVSRSQELG